MIISFFKSNQTIISAFIVLFAIILWLPTLWVDVDLINYKSSLFCYIKDIRNFKGLNYFVSVFLVSFQAIYLNSIVNQNKLVKNNGHLVALFYVLLVSFNKSVLTINPVLIVNTIVIVTLHQFFKLYNQTQINGLTFNIGMLIGISILIYQPLLLLFPFFWFVLLYMSTPKWRSFVISIIGVLLPIVYFLVFFFLFDKIIVLKSSLGLNNVLFEMNNQNYFSANKYYLIVLVLLVILSFFFLLRTIQFDVVKVRKSKVLILILMLMFLFIGVMPGRDYSAVLILTSIPFSFLLANYFNELKKRWLTEFLFTVFIVSIVLGYFS